VKWNELDTFESAQETARDSSSHGNKASGPIKAFFFLVLFGSIEPPLKYLKNKFYRAKILLCKGGLKFVSI
jgi:hypothetical protein